MTQHQAKLLVPALFLWGFSLRIDGIQFMVRRRFRGCGLDLAGVLAHFALWLVVPSCLIGFVPALIHYIVVTAMMGPFLAFIFIPPHVGKITEDTYADEPDFFVRQLRCTRNTSDSMLLTILMGGLNSQIEHHLLPHVPCIRLRRARPVVRGFCRRHGLPYEEVSYWLAVVAVYKFLAAMGKLARPEEA